VGDIATVEALDVVHAIVTEAAEDHQQQDQQHRHGEPFGLADVRRHLGVDRDLHRHGPVDPGRQAGGGQASRNEFGLDGLVGLVPGRVSLPKTPVPHAAANATSTSARTSVSRRLRYRVRPHASNISPPVEMLPLIT
jgi:hypothetical protein